MPLSPTTSSDSRDPAERANQHEIRQSVLLTVLYADLFDYPLTQAELYHRLIDCTASRREVRRAVDALTKTHLDRSDGYITWSGSLHLIDRRRRRERLSSDVWPIAERYAQWLRWIPFVRMVAVSGSLALDNATPDSDIDLFCITDNRRLWIARVWLVFLSRLTRLLPAVFPRYLCPNYLLTFDALRLEDRNLFIAYETVQAVPLWGDDVHRTFIRANSWIEQYLPQRDRAQRRRPSGYRSRPVLVRTLHWMLAGKAGDILDDAAFRLFVGYYRKRAERRGWSWHRLQEAYRRDRYTIPEGGYVQVVRRYFRRYVRARTGDLISDRRLSDLFPDPPERDEHSCYDWATLFEEQYGLTD